MQKPERQKLKNEVSYLITTDRKTVFAIIKRKDGNLDCIREDLRYDPDEKIYYWSLSAHQTGGIYGALREAEDEIVALHPELFEAG